MSDALPQIVADRYRLVKPLGQGGMGRVWMARDEVLHRDVAIKELVPPPGLTPEERREMRERSLREARAIARLNHINVVRVFDVLRTDGDPWIVMEYVPSRSLQDVLADDGPVAPARAAEIGLAVLGALKAAHKAGMLHRDVKPGNVLIGDDGRVVLTDFGLATVPGDPTVTRTGLVLGSPAYIAPERARDGTTGPEADLWSLGATLYAAVEGQSPYARSSAIATLTALATEPPPPPKNAGPLKAVLAGLLRKDPTQRINAEVAERLLRRVTSKRSRGPISLLDGVRRPGPNGPREARPTVVPAPRPAETPPAQKPSPPPAQKSVQKSSPPAVPPPPAAKTTVLPSAIAQTPSTGSSPAGASSPADEETKHTPTAAPTARMPGPASGSAPVLGRAPSQAESDNKGPFLTGKRWVWVAGGVAALLLALFVIVPLANRDPDDNQEPGTGAGATSSAGSQSAAPQTSTPAQTPSATPSPTGLPEPVVPAGWFLHTDKTGFRMPLPNGWKEYKREPNGPGPEDQRVYFQDGKGRWLLIDQTTTPKGRALADWIKQEKTRSKSEQYIARKYSLVSIKEVDYHWENCADWEWTETDGGRRMHVRNRGFVTAKDKGYAIRWNAPAEQWDADLAIFNVIADGFRPVRDGRV
ncbi:serine/threonine-protein kinase [Micromonospora polyrhachis]|uniref:non-specific serine/threonine protein kinase n=1 Tax=Micromonospora polyrhachis TaxID=1282883 RepID=A0A7W7SS52_9ACTN|nr:serine/threonine-protein kinase [Micromonospora polyrhachis]MBB4959977.1 serine/threonine protein kinase [Micromonospora polyrhachis]